MNARLNPRSIAGWVLITLFVATTISAQTTPAAPPKASETPALRDGQHDFDGLLGKWKFHLKRLDHPLTGSHHWIEFDGTNVCRPIWNGKANYDEVELEGPGGQHIEGMTIRLYSAQSHQWSLYWASSAQGTLPPPPTVGSFDANGRGEFYDQEPFNGRMIFVRYVWKDITPESAHFEESFSDDGGKTWELWWITDQVRVKE
jgi:hypothetical protein